MLKNNTRRLNKKSARGVKSKKSNNISIPIIPWESEKLFFSGDLFFDDLLQSVKISKHTIDFEVYIFEIDPLGESILHELIQASSRGVRVRLLVDGFGSIQSLGTIQNLLLHTAVEIRIYRPLPKFSFGIFLPWKIWESLSLRRATRAFGKLNKRNHRKVCIIDGKKAYAGGMNVSAVHLQEYSGNRAWRDTSAQVEGHEVQSLTHAFERAWNTTHESIPASIKETFRIFPFWKKKSRKATANSLTRLNDTQRKGMLYYRDMLRRIITAQQRIWITSPYFVPEFFMTRVLCFAARSGVDVRILLPRKNDIFFMKWANRSFYKTLLKAGVKIYEYLPATLHAKTTLIDQWLALGSRNQNHRSLFHDLEVEIVLTQPGSIDLMKQQFLKDLSQSQEILLPRWRKRHWIHGYIERLVLMIKHWI